MIHGFFGRRPGRSDSGQTLIVAAVTLPVLFGFVGLAVDVGYAFDCRRQMQMAADSAAMAGAHAVKANPSISASALANVVRIDAGQNGFENGKGSTTVSVCRPDVDAGCPTTYSYVAADAAVKITINQPKATFFTSIIGFTSMSIGASAVASTGPGGTTSMLLLGTTPGACTDSALLSEVGGTHLTVSDGIYIDSCSNSPITLTGGSTASAAQIAVSAAAPSCPGCTPAPTAAPYLADPFVGLPAPAIGACDHATQVTINSGFVTLNPGVYCGGIMVQGNSSNVTLTPGVYVMNGGGLQVKAGASLHGDGVTIYNAGTAAGDQIHIQQASPLNGGVTLQITAPTSGTYKGIALFQQRSNMNDIRLDGNAVIDVTGVIYAVAANFRFTGGSTSGQLATYTIIVAASASFAGGSLLVSSDFSSIGGNPIGHISVAE